MHRFEDLPIAQLRSSSQSADPQVVAGLAAIAKLDDELREASLKVRCAGFFVMKGLRCRTHMHSCLAMLADRHNLVVRSVANCVTSAIEHSEWFSVLAPCALPTTPAHNTGSGERTRTQP